ncbi:hypothetical protein M1V99_17365 [Enterobacter bugandensis]|uniref:hypothetical protein n=1 Tax=Enterobacter bugandensis TaxID=881260 RepID=UPI002018BF49|nr:hypothetical protein [Enterobacter bugandensis]UQQ29901.1 hypothetical protein M1V99_17365 [Enterobacter bugandensis]
MLTIGVLIATLFGFVLRVCARAHYGSAGQTLGSARLGSRCSATRYGCATAPFRAPTGSFISQLRELEQIREMVTSSTISTIVDLPFFFLFVVVLAIIAPQLAWIASGSGGDHGAAGPAAAKEAGRAGEAVGP